MYARQIQSLTFTSRAINTRVAPNQHSSIRTTSNRQPSMELLALSDVDVEVGLTPGAAVDANRCAFLALARGLADVPARIVTSVLPYPGSLLVKPCSMSDESEAFGLKVANVRPDNSALGKPTVPAVIMMFDKCTGFPKCLLNATYLTALRTAAGSAVATDLFAKADAKTLVVFGAGMQAEAHVTTSLHVRPSISRVVIINRTRLRATELKQSLEERWRSSQSQIEILALSSLEDGDSIVEHHLKSADIICCCTGSATPLFDGNVLSPGTHVNAVGSYEAHTTELDANTVKRSSIILDSEGALPVGDIALYVADGTITLESHLVGMLGDMLVRQSEGEKLISGAAASDNKPLTLFKSVGTAVQDVVTADVAYSLCKAAGLGQSVKL